MNLAIVFEGDKKFANQTETASEYVNAWIGPYTKGTYQTFAVSGACNVRKSDTCLEEYAKQKFNGTGFGDSEIFAQD